MKVTFFSNYLNHHQLPFCLSMVECLGDDFAFVATSKVSDERLKLGYKDLDSQYSFVVRTCQDEERAYYLGEYSDVVIIGSSPTKYIKKRLKEGKLTFRYSERLYRKGISLKTLVSIFIKRTIFESRNTYLLCASAYAARDYRLSLAYMNKCYKWAYFPEVREYADINNVINNKISHTILWVARFIEVKHPEAVIELAKRLKNESIDFTIHMIGLGPLKPYIEKNILENELTENVILLGAMSPDDVRKYMEQSEILLFTSDKGEGWGAVINEAMNSGCAVVSSHSVGAAPFLIKDGENGLLYKDGDADDLFLKTKYLLLNTSHRQDLGKEAYSTMLFKWNPKIAAERIIKLSDELLKHDERPIFEDGPCSKADMLKDNWFISQTKHDG